MKYILESMDEKTTVSELRQLINQFIAARNWEKYHTPKNLSSAIAVEVAELIECFQWMSDEDSIRFSHGKQLINPPPSRKKIAKPSESRKSVQDELADIMCLCIAFANSIDLDISEAIMNKQKINEQQYPLK